MVLGNFSCSIFFAEELAFYQPENMYTATKKNQIKNKNITV